MRFLNYIIDLFYPKLCLNCLESLIKGEDTLCLACLIDLPETDFHKEENNQVEKLFWGKVEVERASSLLFFRKGSISQKLLHELKYRRNKPLGYFLGRISGVEIQDYPLAEVDMIVPVPLHKKKKIKRGYNQSKLICEGLSEILNKPVISNNLIRIKENTTQTNKSVYERYKNTQGIFAIKRKQVFEGKRILLVDDVITTGSTLEGCVSLLNEIKGTTVNVFTIAIATD